jgi:hypothetical protein
MKNKTSKTAMTNVADFSLPKSSSMKIISFKVRVAEIFKSKFDGEASSAFELGMRRAEFEEKQFCRLIDLTEQVPSDFAKNCRKTWQRGAERSRVVQERFKLLIHEKEAVQKNAARC